MNLQDIKNSLAFTLQYMRASEQLLADAIELSPPGAVRDYYIKHLEEERDHAKWLAEDLEGYVLPDQPLAQALAGTMYYQIKHTSPVCLLGYMLALEQPFSMGVLEKWEKEHPPALFRTLRHHAVVDQGHEADLLALIQGLSADDQKLVATAHQWTTFYLNQIPAVLEQLK